MIPILSFAQQQIDSIFLNEISSQNVDVVEIRNSSSTDFEPVDLFLFINGNIREVISLSSLCSSPNDRTIEADDQKGFFASGISPNGGEIVLASRDTIESADDILDYVIWGDVQPDFLDLAIGSGNWIGTETAPVFFSSGSLEYDGDGNQSADWLNQAAASICDPNGTGCNVELDEFEIDSDFICICDGIEELIPNSGFSGFADAIAGLILDSNSTILAMTDVNSFSIDFFEEICIEESLFYQVIAYNGEIANLEIGQNVNDIIGCVLFSDIFPLESIQIDDFTTSLSVDGVSIDPNSQIEVCTLDSSDEDIIISTNSSDLSVFYLVQNNTIVAEVDPNTDFVSSLEPGSYELVAFAYQGELGDSEGFFYLSPNIMGCFLMSEETYFLEILVEGESGCFASSTDENNVCLLYTSPSPRDRG